jgi:hypothetical protein
MIKKPPCRRTNGLPSTTRLRDGRILACRPARPHKDDLDWASGTWGDLGLAGPARLDGRAACSGGNVQQCRPGYGPRRSAKSAGMAALEQRVFSVPHATTAPLGHDAPILRADFSGNFAEPDRARDVDAHNSHCNIRIFCMHITGGTEAKKDRGRSHRQWLDAGAQLQPRPLQPQDLPSCGGPLAASAATSACRVGRRRPSLPRVRRPEASRPG